MERFVSWFQSQNGHIDTEAIGFHTFPDLEGGRGTIALRDIPEGQVLFTIPRSILLSTRTSTLPQKLGIQEWKARKLDIDWSGLILCMMWEDAQSADSVWFEYLETLPSTFATPMFWGPDDLNELKGTSVVGKLGKEEAERDYQEKVFPLVQSRPDLFPPAHLAVHYTVERYHIIGSRILSRSFNVDGPEDDESDEFNNAGNSSIGSGMDVDAPENVVDGSSESGDSEDEDEEDSSDVAMVPMADMLNARFGSENAKLFYEASNLRMITTKSIAKGEQIWNTYGDLPNAELLRRYGHVDLLPLPHNKAGNPADVVEVSADLLVNILGKGEDVATKERIDWWLEEGGDDIFVFETDLEITPALGSLIRLLMMTSDEWDKTRSKSKPPKPKMSDDVLDIIQQLFQRRLGAYPTTLEDDETALLAVTSTNQKNALVVRIGEKRILRGLVDKVQALTTPIQSVKRKPASKLVSTKAKRSKS